MPTGTSRRAWPTWWPYAPALPELTPAQELALLARCLFSEGYDDHLAGYITHRQPDGTFLVNPFGLTWDELRASDVMRMDADVALLANHGVLVLAGDIEQAYLRAMSFEWRCRRASHVAAAGGGTPMNREAARNYGDFFNTHQFTGLFEAMARRELRRDPTILD
jgi:ribulose-5-phosphate 4-epimerase/fuculose-1-phosphate aldolase